MLLAEARVMGPDQVLLLLAPPRFSRAPLVLNESIPPTGAEGFRVRVGTGPVKASVTVPLGLATAWALLGPRRLFNASWTADARALPVRAALIEEVGLPLTVRVNVPAVIVPAGARVG